MLKTLLFTLGVYKLYEKWLWYQVKDGIRPEHIAIILDGNRRWASGRQLNPWVGHHYGAEKVEDLLKWCLNLGVKSISLYAFSTENFRRIPQEVDEIMQIAEIKLRKLLKDENIHKHRVRVKVIGRLNLLPKRLHDIVRQVEEVQVIVMILLAFPHRREHGYSAHQRPLEGPEFIPGHHLRPSGN